jgi:hypothetical protein
MDWTYFHLVMNHFPVIGAIFGMVILGWGLFRGSEEVKNLGLSVMVVTALVAIPVYLTGEPAEETVERLPGVLEAAIEQHEEFAKYGLAAAIASGVAALVSLIYSWFRPGQGGVGRLMAIVTLALSIATVGAMSWTAKLGGVIRHTEISAVGAQTNEQPEKEKTEGGQRGEKDDDD